RQAVSQVDPGKSIFSPGMVVRQEAFRLIETANRDIDLFGISPGLECEWRPAGWAKGAQPSGEREFSRLALREAKFVPAKRRPENKRWPGAPAAIGAVAVGNIVWRPGRFVPHRAAQATTAQDTHDNFAMWLRFDLPAACEITDSECFASMTRTTVFQ